MDECPKHLAPKDSPSTHSIFSPGSAIKDGRNDLSFDTRPPTSEELETCKWVTLTLDEFWDPKSKRFHEEEEKLESLNPTSRFNKDIMSLLRTLTDISDIFDD